MKLIFLFIIGQFNFSGNLFYDFWKLKYEKYTPSGLKKVYGERYFADISLFPKFYFLEGDIEIRYINSPKEIEFIYGENIEKIFRKNIKISKENFEIEFFDIYKSFGKGILAGFVKDENILLERFLKGFSSNLKIGIFDFGFTYGRPYEYLYYSRNFFKDTLDEFKITEAKINLLKGIEIGLYHSFYDQNIFFEPDKKRAEFLGYIFDLKSGILTIYEEYSRRKGIDKEIPSDTLFYSFSKGFANYTQIIFSIKEFTISGEYEKYKKYSNPYSYPPCIHPYGISISNGKDEEGFSLNFLFPLYFFDFDLNLSKSFYRDKKIEEEKLNLRAPIYSFLFNFTFDNSYLKGVNLIEGFKLVEKRKERSFKGKIDYSFPLITLSFGFEARKREDLIYDTLYKYIEPYYEFEIFHKFGSLSTSYSKDKEKKDYYSFEKILQLGKNIELSFFYGKQRGELKCSGGICRYEPPFEGFKAKIIYSF